MSFPSFDNALICDVCSTEKTGEFYPVLVFSDGFELRFDRVVCDDCRSAATVDDWLTDSIWLSVIAAADERKKTRPIRDRTKLKFVAATSNSDESDTSSLTDSRADQQAKTKGGFS